MSWTTNDFLKALFGLTPEDHHISLSALDNERGGPLQPRENTFGSKEGILKFLDRYGAEPGRGTYCCVGTVKPGAKRLKANIQEIVCLHADIDFKDIEEDRATVEKRLAQLPLIPSITNFSGNGIHAYWLLKEPLVMDSSEAIERVEEAYKRLAVILAADMHVCHIAALMRLPGSHNTKQGAMTPVEVLTFDGERRFELDDIEEQMLDVVNPIFARKDRVQSTPEDNPFTRIAEINGIKPRTDVEGLVALMAPGNVHTSQVKITSALLSRGEMMPDEVVEFTLRATMAMSDQYNLRYKEAIDLRKIRGMCDSWLKKHPELRDRKVVQLPPPKAAPKPTLTREPEGEVINLAQKRKAKPKAEKGDRPSKGESIAIIAEEIIKQLRAGGRDILLTEGDLWLYDAGLWRVMTPADRQYILVQIQTAFQAFQMAPRTSDLNACFKLLNEHPSIYRAEVLWSDGEVLVCENGVVRLSGRSFEAHAPSHYARRKIGAPYGPDATCPMFLELLQSMFSDRGDERDAYVRLMKTWWGASLAISKLSREERKALLLAGPSRTGKTELATIFRLMFGDPIASPAVSELSERFGLSSLYGAAAWVRDDAINEGDKLDPQRFKTVVTGEAIDIERKNQHAVRVELKLPILLTTNSLPRARDNSDAVFNRSIVIEMNNVVSERDAVEARRRLGVPRGQSIGQFIFEREAAGILNWMLDGLDTLQAHGSYAVPESVLDAGQRFKDQNNPVAEFAREAVVRCDTGKVNHHDILCAFHGWMREQDGDKADLWGSRRVFPALRAYAPWVSVGRKDAHNMKFVHGIHLTPSGEKNWEYQQAENNPASKGDMGGSRTSSEINRSIGELPPGPKSQANF